MIKKIVTDVNELSKVSRLCRFNDLEVIKNKAVAQDLVETANNNRDNCVGLAANQIGSDKSIVLVRNLHAKNFEGWIMVNPQIFCSFGGIKKGMESCLSFPGRESTPVRRYKKIKVSYQDVDGKVIRKTLKGIEARIVQHELDHLKGILI